MRDREVCWFVVLACWRDLLDPLFAGVLPHTAQHGIDETGGTGADDLSGQCNGFGARGVRRNSHVEDLVDAKAQHVDHGVLDLLHGSVDAGSEHRVEPTLGAQGAVEQFGGEGGVAAAHTVATQDRGQDEVGVGVVLAHSAHRVVGRQT